MRNRQERSESAKNIYSDDMETEAKKMKTEAKKVTIPDSEPMDTETDSKANVNTTATQGEVISQSPNDQQQAPRGKVVCLLCRGFITYKNSDRTRFKSHMEEEHEVKFNSDVVLACSVFTKEERAMIVRASLQRLAQVGDGQVPSAPIRLFQNVLPTASPPVTPIPQQSATPQLPVGANRVPSSLRISPPPLLQQSAAPQLPVGINRSPSALGMVPPPTVKSGIVNPSSLPSPTRGGGGRGRPPAYRGVVRGVSSVRATPPPPPPKLLGNNQSISISVVDQRTKCNNCDRVFPNNTAMTDHMKTEHLNKFPGISINTPKEVRERELNKARNAPAALEFKPSKDNSRNSAAAIEYKPAAIEYKAPNPSSVHSLQNKGVVTPISVKNLQALKSKLQSPHSPNQTQLQRTMVQSPLNPAKTSLTTKMTPTRVPDKPPAPVSPPDHVVKCNTCGKFIKQSAFSEHKMEHLKEREAEKVAKMKPKRREEKVIDFVDMLDDDSDEESDKPSKQKSPEKNIQCSQCDKKLATNMALRMHINLKHPVKQEIDYDTEELLVEDDDLVSSEKIKNEVESMETMELLDNLVNFLESET